MKSLVALLFPCQYQRTKRVNTSKLVDPHSHISICIDTEAEKFTGWHVSDCTFSITQVFVLEKSGIVTNSIFWPFSPEKKNNRLLEHVISRGWLGPQFRYPRQLWQIRWHILVFVSSFTKINSTYSSTKHRWVYHEELCCYTLVDFQQSTHVDTSLK